MGYFWVSKVFGGVFGCFWVFLVVFGYFGVYLGGNIKRCFKGVSRVFQGCFKGVSRKFQGSFKEVFKGFKEVSWMFLRAF